MKFLNLSVLFLIVFAFANCQKENSKDDYKTVKDDIKMEDKDCFELVYPISYTMPDGTTVTGADEEAVNTALKTWYTANPNSKGKYFLVYPVDVSFKDGTTKTIVNESEMIDLKKYCEGEKDDCFELVYPISYTMPDGSTVMGSDEDAVNTALKAWYTANSDSKDKYFLVYPVNVSLKDGTVKNIADEDAMIALKKDCEDSDG